MTRTPKQARSKATYESIVDAGFVALTRFGPAETTTRRIADIAGVGVGSLYEYFDDKEQVFDAMTERLVARIVSGIQREAPSLLRKPPSEVVRSLAGILREVLEADGGRYLSASRYALQTQVHTHIVPLQRALFELALRMLAERPEIGRVKNLRAMTYIWIHGGISAVIQHLSDANPPVTFDELVEGLVQMVSNAFPTPKPSRRRPKPG